MFVIGQKVKFCRSNGSWSHGRICSIDGRSLNIEWISRDGKKKGSKKVDQLLVKPLRSNYVKIGYLIFGFLIFFLLIFMVLIFIDTYLHLKQV